MTLKILLWLIRRHPDVAGVEVVLWRDVEQSTGAYSEPHEAGYLN